MTDYDKKAYKEAYIVVNFLLNQGEIVVPQELIATLENKMDKQYNYNLNDIDRIDLLPDTEKLLTKIYMECIVNEKEKKVVMNSVHSLQEVILKEPKETINNNENNKLLQYNLSNINFWNKIKIKINRWLAYNT